MIINLQLWFDQSTPPPPQGVIFQTNDLWCCTSWIIPKVHQPHLFSIKILKLQLFGKPERHEHFYPI